MGSAVALALQVFTILPSLIEAGLEVKELIETTQAALAKMQAENRDPTEEEWATINSKIDALRAQLHS